MVDQGRRTGAHGFSTASSRSCHEKKRRAACSSGLTLAWPHPGGSDSCDAKTPEVVCAFGTDGVLLMQPLLLHASSPARVPGYRRVIHLDFASVQLPNGLRWFSDAAHAISEHKVTS